MCVLLIVHGGIRRSVLVAAGLLQFFSRSVKTAEGTEKCEQIYGILRNSAHKLEKLQKKIFLPMQLKN